MYCRVWSCGANHAAGALECADVELSAIVSRNDEKRLAFRDAYQVSVDFADLDEALASDTFDAVDLCVPNHVHVEYALKCAKAGKHILIEKPMANTYADCKLILDAAKEYGVTLMTGQSRRYHDAVLLSKKMADEGAIGEVISITGSLLGYLPAAPTPWWNNNETAGGLMIPLWGNHIFDYILYMFGESPERVYCESYSNGATWEGEDEATVLMGFSKGRFATVRMSWNTRLTADEEWEGQSKMLKSSDIIYERYIQGSQGTLKLNDETMLTLNGAVKCEGAQPIGNFALQYSELANAIKEGRAPLTDGDVGAENVLVQDAALLSAKEKRVVFLSELRG